MTTSETKVLEAAKAWYKVVIKANNLTPHEHSLFIAVTEWLKSSQPWEVPPTSIKLPPLPPLPKFKMDPQLFVEEIDENDPVILTISTIPAASK